MTWDKIIPIVVIAGALSFGGGRVYEIVKDRGDVTIKQAYRADLDDDGKDDLVIEYLSGRKHGLLQQPDGTYKPIWDMRAEELGRKSAELSSESEKINQKYERIEEKLK